MTRGHRAPSPPPPPRPQTGGERPSSPRSAPPLPKDSRWEHAVASLHRALERAGYGRIRRIPTTPNPFALPAEPFRLAAFLRSRGTTRRLMEPTAIPGVYRRLERWRDPTLERAFAFFFLGEALEPNAARALLQCLPGAPTLEALLEAGVVVPGGPPSSVRARIRVVPVERLLLVTDPYDRSIPGFTYVGRDSLLFAERLSRRLAGRRVERLLDLCCGAGVQALALAPLCGRAIGTDLNPRAVAMAGLNARLSGVADRTAFAATDLAEGIRGRFDVVVANPPYVWMPPSERKRNLDGYGGEEGLEVVSRILESLDGLLTVHGEAWMVCESPVIGGRTVLLDRAEAILRNSGLGAEFHPLYYSVNRLHARFQAAQGVTHNVYFEVHASRDLPPGIRVGRLAWPHHAAYLAYVTLARRWLTR